MAIISCNDNTLLFAARSLRLFSYGSLTVCLLLFLQAVGLSAQEVGILLTAIFVGDLGITLWLTNNADKFGRRRTLLISAALKALAGMSFSSTSSLTLLAIAGIFGVISPAGGEIGPFLSVEQAALAQLTAAPESANPSEAGNRKTASLLASIFGWYNAAGYASLAAGALLSGWLVRYLQSIGWADLDAYRSVLHLYAVFGLLKMCIYAVLSAAVETEEWRRIKGLTSRTPNIVSARASDLQAPAPPSEGASVSEAADDGSGDEEEGQTLISSGDPQSPEAAGSAARASAISPPAAAATGALPRLVSLLESKFGLRSRASRSIVAKLSALFCVDAFAGGFVMQSVLVRWFADRWGLEASLLGTLLMGANVAAGISSVGAGWMVKRFGAVNTMVFTHLPSNVLLALVPLMPTAEAAVALLLLRFCLSQMDVPARQAYVASVVAPDERSAAAGITNVVRSLGVALSPVALAWFTGDDVRPDSATYSAPFWLAAALKSAYDLTLYAMFASGSGSGAQPAAPEVPITKTAAASCASEVKVSAVATAVAATGTSGKA